MNLTEIVRTLRAVSCALDKLEVKGRENMDILLGSIQATDKCAVQLEKFMKDMEPEVRIEAVPDEEAPKE